MASAQGGHAHIEKRKQFFVHIVLAMDGPCGCRARGVLDMIDCIKGGMQLSVISVADFLEIVNAPEFSLLGGGILTNVFLFFVIKRKESPAQRARANRFFDVFSRKT